MRFRDEERSEEVVDELVLHQDFLSVFKATHRFPCVATNGVSFPFDEVSVSLAPFLVACDCLYFIFFFTFNKVRRWFHEVGAMSLGLAIR